MSPRAAARTQACSAADGANCLRNACKFIEVAELLAVGDPDVEYSNQAATLAVLAGIAASDAACCKAMGRRSRAPDHPAAIEMVQRVRPGGDQAANALKRLLGLKDAAQYGLSDIGRQDLKAALRQAHDLIHFAERVLRP